MKEMCASLDTAFCRSYSDLYADGEKATCANKRCDVKICHSIDSVGIMTSRSKGLQDARKYSSARQCRQTSTLLEALARCRRR